MKTVISFLLLALLLTSCEEVTDWSLPKGNNDFIVVNAIITSELKNHVITLTMPISVINEKPQPVTRATVLVSTDQQVYAFHENPVNSGIYISDTAFFGASGQTYSVLITSGNKVYSAKAVLAAPSDFEFLHYDLDETGKQYRFTITPKNYNPANPAMYEVLLDWSKASGFENINPDSCKAKLYFYTLPTIDVSEVFAPGMESITFPPGTVITERRYSLTREHAAFFRAVLLETTWQGGFFNTTSANVPTNLSEGASGFFGACGVVEKQEIAK